MMRLFVGVELDEAARTVAVQTAVRLQDTLRGTVSANWVPAANLHLTVRFIGHVPDDRAPALLDALSPPIDLAAFDVALSGCGSFPPKGPPRVIWIGLSRGLPGLEALHEEFDRRVRPFGYEPETRPFSAHLTLARVKDVARGQSREVAERIRAVDPHAAAFRVTQATVFESRLSPNGPTYHALSRVDLQTTDC